MVREFKREVAQTHFSSFLNLVGFRIMRIVKVSEEKVLPVWAARVLSDDVWLSAVLLQGVAHQLFS